MSLIEFLDDPWTDAKWPCPACGAVGAKVELRSDGGLAGSGAYELAKCSSCGSWFFLGEDPVVGYTDEALHSDYWIHYVQSGAGINAMLVPLLALEERARGRFLDVGCGFGFVPDFWARSGRGEAVGLELASYGKIGRRLLGADIRPAYLSDCEDFEEGEFDIVYSSEVIEHVRDPAGFLRELARVLKADGILVLTTPSAACVSRDVDPPTLYAALSPGLHYFLLSKERLEGLLEEAGFHHHVVVDDGRTLMAWASREPISPPDISRFDWDEYLGYLEKLAQSDNPHLRGGALYRLFKDSLNTGRTHLASQAFSQLETLARDAYGIDLTFPDISGALRADDYIGRLERYPAWLAGTLFFGGIYAGNVLRDPSRKLRLLEASTHMLKNEMEVGLRFAQEAAAFLPAATFNYRMALAELLSVEIPRGLDIEVPDANARPTPDQISTFRERLGGLRETIDSFSAETTGRANRG